MYLEYYDISMKFDFSEKYKKEPRIKIDFNINGLDNVPFILDICLEQINIQNKLCNF